MRDRGKLFLISAAFLFAPSVPCLAEGDGEPKLNPNESETIFLNRLMRAESGGRRFAKNPASSALGPYQFVEATFLDVVQRNLPGMSSGKSDAEVLQLRTDPKVARDVALIYMRENASVLTAAGLGTTAANLRLAFFAGASGAIKILQAKAEEPVSNLLSSAAIQANPFLKDMTASQLIARAAREAEGAGRVVAVALPGARAAKAGPQIAVRCNLRLASCRKWLSLAEKRLAAKEPRLSAARRG
jgi:hypothetical protein